MKRLIFFISAILVTNLSWAQEEAKDPNEIRTIFKNGAVKSNGGYGAIMINYTKIDDRDAITMGAKGGWVINHKFTLGMGGYGFISEPQMDNTLGKDYEYAGGYGGLLFEPIIAGKSPIHLSIPIIIGAGGIAYTASYINDDYHRYDETYEDSDAFFVIEPGVELEFNVVKFMRFALACSYRYTSDVELRYTSISNNPKLIADKDFLHGWNVGIAFKFGKF